MSTIFLSGRDLSKIMTHADYATAVEEAFRLSSQGLAPSPPPLHIAGVGGGFHAKGAALLGTHKRVALKLNANFPGNPARGLPTIQGVLALCDAENGALLALMDSIEITLRRTAAASALAARLLARPGSRRLAIVGCGAQAAPHAQAIADALSIEHVLLWDIDAAKAANCANDIKRSLDIAVEVAPSLAATTLASDVIVTCTTARKAFLGPQHLSPGALIAAVGADNPDKQEIAPMVFAQATVVADVLSQCIVMGDLRNAIAAGAITADQKHRELKDVVTQVGPHRRSDDEIIVFDSTGAAIQDVACAALAYERARERGVGLTVSFA